MTDILQLVKDRDPGEREFHQAVMEVVESVQPVLDHSPEYRKAAVMERITEPERVILFRVPWVDETECVGCNLCSLVCPVDGCISMVEQRRAPDEDTWDQRVRDGRDHVPGGLGEL